MSLEDARKRWGDLLSEGSPPESEVEAQVQEVAPCDAQPELFTRTHHLDEDELYKQLVCAAMSFISDHCHPRMKRCEIVDKLLSANRDMFRGIHDKEYVGRIVDSAKGHLGKPSARPSRSRERRHGQGKKDTPVRHRRQDRSNRVNRRAA